MSTRIFLRATALIVATSFLITVHAIASPISSLLQPRLHRGDTIATNYQTRLTNAGITRALSGTTNFTVLGIAGQTAHVKQSVTFSGQHIDADFYFNMATLEAQTAQKQAKQIESAVYLFYNPYIWGTPPEGDLHAGETWNVHLSKPWQLGPPGSETVKVISLDPAAREITFHLQGSGYGPSAEEVSHPITATGSVQGHTVSIPARPGKATRESTMVIKDGVVVKETTTARAEIAMARTTITPAENHLEQTTVIFTQIR